MKELENAQGGQIAPEFISGLVESDGCFSLINESRNGKPYWRPTFYITQKGEGEPPALLQQCSNAFGGGQMIEDKRNGCYSLRINSREQLMERVLPHFHSHPLLGEKRGDFLLLQQACQLLAGGARGGGELGALARAMNRMGPRYRQGGYKRPNPLTVIAPLHPQYVSGLVQGDGSFYFSFLLRPPRARPAFALGQHVFSRGLLEALQAYFSCGRLYKVGETHWRWAVSSPGELRQRILPHFSRYPLLGEKGARLQLFSRGCAMMEGGRGRPLLYELVDLLYDSHAGGRHRRRSRLEYLRAIS